MMKLLVPVILSILPVLSAGNISDLDLSGTCANGNDCNERCHKISEMFSKENGKSPWMSRYPSIANIFQEYNVKVAIEIGVARGGLSYYLLSSVGDLIVHGIDSFSGSNQRSSKVKKSSAAVEWAHAVLYHLREFGCRFRLYKGFSKEVAKSFSLASVDCVFLDGDHSYDGVASDIASYGPIVRPGGVIIFDDYDATDFRGVKNAVDQFAKINDITIIRLNDNGNVMIVKPFGRPLIYQIGPSDIHSSKVIRTTSAEITGKKN